MKNLIQIFNRLKLSKENGLFIANEQRERLFSNRVERLLENTIKPDAFFCIDNKPFILFFENLGNRKNAKFEEIWNFNESPIVIISEQDSVGIYNGFKYLTQEKTLGFFGKEEKLNDFKYFELVTGKTWEKYQKDFDSSHRIDYHLLKNIESAREILLSESLSPELTNSLIGKVIFVRYLIDREIRLDFEQKGKSRKWTNSEFCKLLSDKNQVKQFFEYLKDKFNGDLFPITESELDSIPDKCFLIIINLLSGDIVGTGQKSLFDLYDFSIIPVEFISNVYEVFIGQDQQEKQGAYYTPLFLVDYILAETVEKKFQKHNSYSCKVLDPACGSGIFLVETLRKIIEQYQKNNPNFLDNPDKYKDDLIQLASDNIFGVDKDMSAINVAIFSIYLTLLDYQNPSDIEFFRFPLLLNNNFFSSDFFSKTAYFNSRIKNIEFDFILGNPPWKRGKGEEKKPLFVKYIDDRKKEESSNIEISNNEIAQAFVFRVSDFATTNTKISLIVTSKLLYNLNAKKFRQYFLDNYLINKVFELAPVRKEVFNSKGADTPAAVLFYQYGYDTNKSNIVEHITLKPSRFFSLFKVFTIQRGDYKKVSQNQLKEFDFLWKILVYGSYLDFNLISRLKSADYFKISDIVFHGNDYIIKQGMKRKDGDTRIDVSELKNYDFIDLTKKQLQQFQVTSPLKKWSIDSVGYVYRENGQVATNMFSPPVLLIKETVKTNLESVSAIANKKVVFTDKITAIKRRNNSDDDNYYNISALLNSKLFSYFIGQSASTTGIMIEQQVHDIEKFSFPYFSNKEFKPLIRKIEQSLLDDNHSTNTIVKDLKRELDSIVLSSFNLSDIEKDTVDYTLDCVIPIMMRLKGFTSLYNPIRKENEILSAYAKLFFARFNPIYKKTNQKIVVDIKHTNQIIGLFFKLLPLNAKVNSIQHTEVDSEDILSLLYSLGIEKITDRLFIQKDIRGFEKDGFYIIKPNEKRLWHKAIGHLDVNEFMDAILVAGKKRNFNV